MENSVVQQMAATLMKKKERKENP